MGKVPPPFKTNTKFCGDKIINTMKKENKNTILDASGWLWLAIMMVAAGVVGLMQPMTFESVTFSIMLIICGAALIYAVVSGIIMFWKKD